MLQELQSGVDAYLDVAKKSLGGLFESAFEVAENVTPNKVANDMEFLTFANACHRFHKESERIAVDKSSSLKSMAFIYNFILAPCLSQESQHDLKYVQ